MTTELAYLSAHEALALFRAKKLSPVELMDAVLTRADAVNPSINAFTDTFFEDAFRSAQAAEARYLKGNALPLDGLPVAVKDAQRVKGQRTTHGSLLFMDNVEDHSDPMVERLLAAGAIIHARTTTPEFCLSGMCHSRAWGVTRNPFHFGMTPGGSSGGSAAALAAGASLLATGTDIGGSVRIPAACCGVVGYKPPHGRNPDGPPNNFDLYNHPGPMARSVADVALMQNVVSGPHPLDHWSLRDVVRIPETFESVRGLRIAYSMNLGYMEVEPDVVAETRKALDVFRALGCVVEEVAVPWDSSIEQAAVHWYCSMQYGRQTIWHAKDNARMMTPYALGFARFAEKNTSLDDMARSWEKIHEMQAFFGPLMEKYDLFICPTNAVPAVKAEHNPTNPEFYVNGKKVDPENGWIMTWPFNMLHFAPVMSVPSGRASNGVPTGIQLVGRTFDDLSVFSFARAYELAAPELFVGPGHHPM